MGETEGRVYDLASLAKPLVTAPLALAFLDLDADRRGALGFHDRPTPLTARQLLSHSSGLPPWRPFTGEGLARQLRRPVPEHPLLRAATPGLATYSDLNYRLLAELLEADTGLPFPTLAAPAGLGAFPWQPSPTAVPEALDADAWRLATGAEPPPLDPSLPQDANARAGMRGHAGFAATAPQLRAALARWLGAGWPHRMAQAQAEGEGGARWGLGLQVARRGAQGFGELLSRLPLGLGLHVIEAPTDALPATAPTAALTDAPSGWWFHTGFAGAALFFRPEDGACVALLAHRRGPDGALLDVAALHGRRLEALRGFVGESGA
jgi:CubicO group peptidase (beta-lactamase class C family)